MITRRKSSKLPPRSMLEVPNVLKGTSGQSTLHAVTQLEYKVAEKYDQEGDAAGNKDWGDSVVGNEGIPPALKKAMMSAVLSVDKVKLLATEGRNDDFFHEIFINRMSSINDARQQRQIDAPQHLWHTDGTVPHLTAVLTIYDSELDSNIRSAQDVGGFASRHVCWFPLDYCKYTIVPSSPPTLGVAIGGTVVLPAAAHQYSYL
jgi:hypothetical protein